MKSSLKSLSCVQYGYIYMELASLGHGEEHEFIIRLRYAPSAKAGESEGQAKHRGVVWLGGI